MSGFIGRKKSLGSTEPILGALKLQTSAYGLAIPVIYGRTQVPMNLIDYTDFKSIPHEERSEAGKGGGSTVRTTYTYSASIVMALGEGLIGSVRRVWVGKEMHVGTAQTSRQVSTAEEFTVPAGGVVTVSQSAAFGTPGDVFWLSSGWDASPPAFAQGREFTRSGGVYTFDSAYVGERVQITYSYTITTDAQSALGSLGMGLKQGQVGQSPWAYMASAHPERAFAYSGIAYIYAQDYAIDNSAQVPNHRFEVDGALQFSPTIPDANPADVVADILRNERYGVVGFPPASLDSLAVFRTYCTAAGLFVSPAYLEQRPARDVLGELIEACNADPCWVGDKLRIVPRGDTTITGNGATYTPDMTPVFALTVDDFIGVPEVERVDESTIPNRVSIECLNGDRELPAGTYAGNYSPTVVEVFDEASIAMTGERVEEPLSWHFFVDTRSANSAARIRLNRLQAVRAKFKFRLPWRFVQLELGDLVTITDARIEAFGVVAKLTAMSEGAKDSFDFEAEEFPIGHANAPLVLPQLGSGFSPQNNIDPGDIVAPMFVEPPGGWTGNGLEVWAAASGASPWWGGCDVYVSLDGGASFKLMGRIDQPCRYGSLTANLDPGAGGQLHVGLAGRGGVLKGVSGDALDALATLSFIGDTAPGEWISYSLPTLTGTNAYRIAGLSRGRFGTDDGPHYAGEKFLLADGSVAESGPLPESVIGKTLFFKFCSYNIFGAGLQQLANVPAYPYTVSGRFRNAGAIQYANNLPNSTFVLGWSGWRVTTEVNSIVIGRAIYPPGFAGIRGTPSFVVFTVAPNNEYLSHEAVMACRPFQTIQGFASVLCDNVSLRAQLVFYDNTGIVVGRFEGNAVQPPASPTDGAAWGAIDVRNFANYTKTGLIAKAPINAASVRLMLLTKSAYNGVGYLSSRCYLTQPMLSQVDAEARALTDWQPGPFATSFAYYETTSGEVQIIVPSIPCVATLRYRVKATLTAGSYINAAITEDLSGDFPTLTTSTLAPVVVRTTGVVTGSADINETLVLQAGKSYRFSAATSTDNFGGQTIASQRFSITLNAK